jgi:alpha-L-fucosidase
LACKVRYFSPSHNLNQHIITTTLEIKIHTPALVVISRHGYTIKHSLIHNRETADFIDLSKQIDKFEVSFNRANYMIPHVKINLINLVTVLATFLLSTALTCNAQNAPTAIAPVPEARQLRWQQMENIAFVHFGLNSFNNAEWGYGDVDLKTFNPSALDCEQWVKTFKAAGIKEVIITAKHHDGFCLWPTHLTDYCICNTPYKNGKGDIVGELAAACKKHGIKFGIYLSPWDRHQASYGTPEYIDYYYKEMRELLTNYGEISEVWLDGANGGDGWYGGSKENRTIDRRNYYDFPRLYQLINQLQPNAVIFSDGGPGCRWMGNERGFAGTTNWSFLRSKDVYPGYDKSYELNSGHADGDKWIPGECDVSIRPGWFYHPEEDSKVKSVDDLVEIYYKSVGRNAQMLLNFPVDRRGLIFHTDSANAVNFHKQILREMKTDLLKGKIASATDTRGSKFSVKSLTDGKRDTYWATHDGITTAQVTFKLPREEKIDRVLLQEYIPLGQRVKSFVIEYWQDGKWAAVNAHEETTTIGYKRIVRFDTVKTSQLRVRFLDARGPLCISRISAYYSGNGKSTP